MSDTDARITAEIDQLIDEMGKRCQAIPEMNVEGTEDIRMLRGYLNEDQIQEAIRLSSILAIAYRTLQRAKGINGRVAMAFSLFLAEMVAEIQEEFMAEMVARAGAMEVPLTPMKES